MCLTDSIDGLYSYVREEEKFNYRMGFLDQQTFWTFVFVCLLFGVALEKIGNYF